MILLNYWTCSEMVQCYNCGQEGHIATNCTNPKKKRSNEAFLQDRLSAACGICGIFGHSANECAATVSTCPLCQKDHFEGSRHCGARNCPAPYLLRLLHEALRIGLGRNAALDRACLDNMADACKVQRISWTPAPIRQESASPQIILPPMQVEQRSIGR